MSFTEPATIPAPRSAGEIAREWVNEFLPQGEAWGGHNLGQLIKALAGPRAVLEADLAGLANELCPGTSVLLFDDYKDLLGPDPWGLDRQALSEAAWRALLQRRWTMRGDQRPAFYIALARYFGADITIDEPWAPYAGRTTCGVSVCAQPIINFCWIVHLPSVPSLAICGAGIAGSCIAGLVQDNPYTDLVRVFRLIKPADTSVYFMDDTGKWLYD
ncbi:DUF2313 domain-containing protein [Formicincola oecophyllae]|uniref:DUF2313 domain-containing protein n=1 Tax=Formicincola oecophyllae TaxID=2558361 RepID=A0A4Y6U8V3_9PROT|nr:DUF2313 domain-containing protein [Formicincola oecophyllae]QDH13802.1 DUF2313 domain-containing protein [Formicincola oecophyllae]